MKRSVIAALWVSVLFLAASCASINEARPDQIILDTGDVGRLIPGLRSWLSWPDAHVHCVAQGRTAELVDLKGSVVIYRCAADN